MPKIRRSTIIDAPSDEVWRILRDFGGDERWHPLVVMSMMEEDMPADRVGAIRHLRLSDGSELREQLLALSDRDMSLSYCLIDTPIPLFFYLAHIRLKPVTDGNRTFWEWQSSFETPAGEEERLSLLVGRDIYDQGMAMIRERLARHGSAQNLRQWSRPAEPPTAALIGTSLTKAAAILVERYGPPDVMQLTTIAVPPPGPSEVTIRHMAIGVNFIDIYCRTGYLNLLSLPGVPGMEAAGTVVLTGSAVEHLQPGDRVGYACLPPGAYAQLRTLSADLVIPLPVDIEERVAAAILLKGMSAHFLLHQVHEVTAGDTVLIRAAAGGVGLILCQWASALGAVVIGTVSKEEKADPARRNGCSHVLVGTHADIAAEVMDITKGRGATVIYDAVGHDTFNNSFDCLGRFGHLVSYGQASGDIGPVDISRFAAKSARLSRPNFSHYTDSREKVTEISGKLFAAIREGMVRPIIGQEFPLAEAAAAHRALESRATVGSTILLP